MCGDLPHAVRATRQAVGKSRNQRHRKKEKEEIFKDTLACPNTGHLDKWNAATIRFPFPDFRQAFSQKTFYLIKKQRVGEYINTSNN